MLKVSYRSRIVEVENLIVGLIKGTCLILKEVKGWNRFRADLIIVLALAAVFLVTLRVIVQEVEVALRLAF